MLKKIPHGVSGIALSIFILSNIFRRYSDTLSIAFLGLGIICYLIYVIRIFSTRDVLYDELNNPIYLSFFATFPMASMLLGEALFSVNLRIGYYLWFFGLIFHGLLIILFVMRYFIDFDLKNVHPTWFLMFTGIGLAATTSFTFGANVIAKRCFYFALVTYILILLPVFYRFIIKDEADDRYQDILSLCAFPGGVVLSAFGAVDFKYDIYLLVAVLIISGIMYVFAVAQIPKIISNEENILSSSLAIATTTMALGLWSSADILQKEVIMSDRINFIPNMLVFISVICLIISIQKTVQAMDNTSCLK